MAQSKIQGKKNTKAKSTSSTKSSSNSNPKSHRTVTYMDEPGVSYKCWCCGREFPNLRGNFTPTNIPLYKDTGFAPVCKKCSGSFYNQMVEHFDGNEQKAMEVMCSLFGLYYNDIPFKASAKINSSGNRFNTYVSKIQINPWTGRSWLDTIQERENNVISSFEDLEENNNDTKADVVVNKDSVKIWGFGFTPEDYEFLNSQYSDWKAKSVIEGKPKEMLVRELCVLKLQQNKALIDGKIDVYNRLTETFQKTLDRANLTPKIEETTEKSNEIPMGMMIERFEKEKPVPAPDEEWEDVDGIIRMFTIYFLGHLCKMLNLNNRYAQAYEEEMAKYRVVLPELDETDDEEDVFDFIFNNGTGQGEEQ